MPRPIQFLALFFSSAFAFIFSAGAVTNNLALTPPMGWNDWNSYGCGISESAVTNNAAIIVAKGLKSAGYQYVDIDDGWASSRDSNGVIQAYSISGKFPHGIPWLADYVHSRGLKLGLYTDDGTNTCSQCITGATPPKDPGSFNYEYVDAFTYAMFGADYLKDDNCNATGEDGQLVYGRMSDGLMRSGRPILFCLCGGEAGNAKGYQSWSPSTGNYWRTTGDIGKNFASMISHIDPDSTSAFAAGPGRWNDPDMLEIGNGEFATNLVAAQTHFTMWCEMAAPLIMGNNLTTMSVATLQILTNAEAIAVDQDPAGEQGILVGGIKDSAEVWSKPLGYDFTTRAVALLNRDTNNSATITCYWTNLDLQSGTATVRDLWAHTDLGTYSDHFTATIPPYGSMLLRIVGTPNPISSAGTNYLSDLQPIYAYTGFGTIVKDKSIGGNTITIRSVAYPKGIGVNSRSGVEYNLGGVCTRFQTTVGIDDEKVGSGSVRFEVFADGARILKTGVLTGSSSSQHIDLDVTGVRRLTLGVDDADDGNSNDHADWANALVIATNVAQIPEMPAGLTAAAGNSIALNWNPTLAAITYNVKRATQTGGPYTTITNVPITTFADSNIVNGQNYFYVVSAVSSLGESSNSTEVATAQCFVPAAPTNVTRSSIAISNIVVKWNASAGATSYNVYRFTGNTPPVQIASGALTTNFSDAPVNAGATYYYYVTAAGSCRESGWANLVGAVVPPPAPTGLTATAGNSQITLSWNALWTGITFNVKRATQNGGPYTIIATNISSAGYLDLTAVNSTTYYYVVSAIDVGGEGPDSSQASATASAPNVVTAYWTNTITAAPQNWNANANWTNAAAFPNGSSAQAIITANISAPQTINLNQPVTIGSMQIGDANNSASYTVAANGGSFTFNDTNTVSLTQISSSKGDVLATPISIATNLVVINNSANPLTFAGDVSSSGGAALTIGSGALQIGDGTTNGSLGSVNVMDNTSLIFNRSNNVIMSGTISGSGSVAQNGTGVLNLSGANSFSGGVTIQNGTVQAGNKLALGAQGNAVVITNGGTLDVNGLNVTNVSLTVCGWGVNSNGAIINNSSSQLHAIQSVTLTGDTAFGGPGNWLTTGNPGRWDIRNSGTTLTMAGGKPFNLYKIGSNQMSFVSVTIDTNLANIDIRQGMMGFEAGSTSMGNPASNLVVRAGATLEFYQSSAASNSYKKQFIFYGDGVTPCITNWPGGGISSIYGQMTLNGNCVIGVNGTSFTNNCAVVGGGNLIKSGAQPLTLGGVSTYTGNTTINGGTMILKGSASISSSANIIVNSGATLDAGARGDTALTLAIGQTLSGNGTLNGNVIVGSGATLAPANSFSVLTFNNNLTLTGGSATTMELNKSLSTNDVIQVTGTLIYGGTLVLTNLSGTLAAGDSFKLFSAGIYSGAFTNISPTIPGINLAWNTNNLSNGILSVVTLPTAPPKIAAMNLSGNNFILSGSNGIPNWPYYVLTTTNIALPPATWTILMSNTFDASGHFDLTNPADGANGRFYLLKMQ